MIAQNGQGGGGPVAGATLVGAQRGSRPNPDNTLTQIVTITATSDTYGVWFSFAVLAVTFDADGAPALLGQKVTEVDAICAHPHVQGFRTEQDQGPSDVLYNYAVITVGTDDLAITDAVSVRMDQINTPAAFGAIDASWGRLAALGAV